MFPYFDQNALDSARFIFGAENVEVEFFYGDKDLVEILDEEDFQEWDESRNRSPRRNAIAQCPAMLGSSSNITGIPLLIIKL